MSGENQGPDLFFAGGECLDRFGVWVRRTDVDLEEASGETFERNSNADAIGRDGILRTWEPDGARAEWLNEIDLDPTRNLIVESEQMGNATFWQESAADQFAFAGIAPDGSNNAALVRDDTQTTFHYVRPEPLLELPADAVYATSVFARLDTLDFLFIIVQLDSANRITCTFDLRKGEIGTAQTTGTAAIVSHTIERSSNGFFRCKIVGSIGSGATAITHRFGPADGVDGSSYTGTGTGSIFVWGAQVEVASEVSLYQTTPRPESASDRKFPSLLLEEDTENLLLRSEELNAVWSVVNSTLAQDDIAAPDGQVTADRVIEDADVASAHQIRQDITKAASSLPYAASFFVRAAGRNFVRINIEDGSNNGVQVSADLNDGTLNDQVLIGTGWTLGQVSISALPDGWFYITSTGTSNTATIVRVEIIMGESIGTYSYDGDGVSGLHLWGLQLEERVSTSSYVRTGVSTATRAADDLFGAFPHPPQEMTGYAKFTERGTSLVTNIGIFQIGGASSGGDPRFVFEGSGTGEYQIRHDNGIASTREALSDGPVFGDLVELTGRLYADGSIEISQSINGGAETFSGRSNRNALQPAWNDKRIYINARGNTLPGNSRMLALKLQRGVRTLDFMRAL